MKIKLALPILMGMLFTANAHASTSNQCIALFSTTSEPANQVLEYVGRNQGRVEKLTIPFSEGRKNVSLSFSIHDVRLGLRVTKTEYDNPNSLNKFLGELDRAIADSIVQLEPELSKKFIPRPLSVKPHQKKPGIIYNYQPVADISSMLFFGSVVVADDVFISLPPKQGELSVSLKVKIHSLVGKEEAAVLANALLNLGMNSPTEYKDWEGTPLSFEQWLKYANPEIKNNEDWNKWVWAHWVLRAGRLSKREVRESALNLLAQFQSNGDLEVQRIIKEAAAIALPATLRDGLN